MKKLLLLVAVISLVVVGAAQAARSGIVLNQSNPTYGDTINFTTSGGSSIDLYCITGPYDAVEFDGAPGDSFTLTWAGGPTGANCTAYLLKASPKGYPTHVVASTTFHVSA